jgi:uncharacterized protein YbjT (DUF2867 family)
MSTVLLTGATGYIGGRLLPLLERSGVRVRALARDPERLRPRAAASTEIVRGDCLDERSLDAALAGVETAFYLVHSMTTRRDFAEADHRAAEQFGRAAAKAGVRRIIYLGGLGDTAEALSPHLRSRNETGERLRAFGVPVVEFKASIVIGAGSLSFEMIRALVERLPVMICPRWIRTLTQPIAVDDLLAYLVAALDLPHGRSHVFEVGGPDVVSYGDLMREYARQRGLRRWLIPVPLLTPRLSGLWLALVTPAQARVGRALVEGLRNSTAVRSDAAMRTFSVRPRPLRDAIAQSIADPSRKDLFLQTEWRTAEMPAARLFARVQRIGGANGWYFGDRLWQWRGWIDRLLGGVGMQRGRSSPDDCAVGDIIDCWRVEGYEAGRRLRLVAEMKVPGRAWLEFEVEPVDGGSRARIRQTATFDPRGLIGRAYWYALFPIHVLMFRGMLDAIVERNPAAASDERRHAA